MKHRSAIIIAALGVAFTGCGYHYTHAIPTMRERAAETLSCEEDITLMRQDATAYAEGGTYRASGCGGEVWFSCEGEGHAMRCERRGGAAYASPHPRAPHGVVKIAALFHAPLQNDFRRTEVMVGDALIPNDDGLAPRAIPVSPGPRRFSFRSADVDIVRELRPFTWTTTHRERRHDGIYRVTQRHTGLRETSTPVERSSCRTDFALDVRPGATYRVLFQQLSPGSCTVHCVQEDVSGDVVRPVACTGAMAGK